VSTGLVTRRQVANGGGGYAVGATASGGQGSGPCAPARSRAGRLLQQVEIGAVDLAGGAGYADLAGAATGEVAVVPAGLDFGGLAAGGGLGKFGEQEPPTAGEAAECADFLLGGCIVRSWPAVGRRPGKCWGADRGRRRGGGWQEKGGATPRGGPSVGGESMASRHTSSAPSCSCRARRRPARPQSGSSCCPASGGWTRTRAPPSRPAGRCAPWPGVRCRS